MRVINAHADRTGKKVMYAFNISDELDAMQRHYDKVVSAGGTCAMISLNSVGLAGAKKICDLGKLAIHGHRNGWGMMNRHPLLGIEFPAYQKIWRLAGVDQIHVNGIANKFWESDDSVVRSIEACQKLLFPAPVPADVSRLKSQESQSGLTSAATKMGDFRSAGCFLRPMGWPGAGNLSSHQDSGSALHGGRRHHGASRRPGGRRAFVAKMVGSCSGRADARNGGGKISRVEKIS